MLHHSDQGSRHAGEKFQKLMADSGVTCSMSRSGNVWDNAAMESFFSSLKTERIRGRAYRTSTTSRVMIAESSLMLNHHLGHPQKHPAGLAGILQCDCYSGFEPLFDQLISARLRQIAHVAVRASVSGAR